MLCVAFLFVRQRAECRVHERTLFAGMHESWSPLEKPIVSRPIRLGEEATNPLLYLEQPHPWLRMLDDYQSPYVVMQAPAKNNLGFGTKITLTHGRAPVRGDMRDTPAWACNSVFPVDLLFRACTDVYRLGWKRQGHRRGKKSSNGSLS